MLNGETGIVISIRGLVVGFGNQVVLDSLSLDVRRGEILGLVGASGGGKSVLLRAIIGLIAKGRGRIELSTLRTTERRDASREERSEAAMGGEERQREGNDE
jgi:phospholipid/cholesterol/gamma-HCH transport system ATP-binding protein